MAGSENRVTVVIDGENDAGGAFASATAEAKAFQKAVTDSMRSDIAASRADQAAIDARSRAWYNVVRAVQAVRDGEQKLAQVDQELNRGFASKANESLWSKLLSGNGGNEGGGGFLKGLLGGIAGMGGKSILGSVLGPLLGGIGSGLIVGPILVGLTSLIADLAAAGMGVAAFGALAVPTFSKIAAAVTGTGKAGRQAMDALSPGMRTVAIDVKQLMTGFGEMAAKFAPSLQPLMITLLDIANKVMPLLLPLAQKAATAFDGLLQHLNKFASSKGFQSFVTSMSREIGPTITTLGTDVGKLVVAFGNLMKVAASPAGLRILNAATDILVGTINALAWAINRIGGNMKKWGDIAHQTACKFDEFRNDTAHYFDDARHAIASFGDFVAHFFTADIPNWINQGIRFFQQLPVKINSALASLPGEMYRMGVNILMGLLHGLESAGSQVLSYISGLASNVLSTIGGILGIGSPSRKTYQHGVWLAQGLANGWRDGLRRYPLTGLPGFGPGAPGGGGLRVQLEWAAGTGASDPLLAWIRQQVRIKGGGSVQTAFGRP